MNSTEHGRNNAQCGQELDNFGSITEPMECKFNGRDYRGDWAEGVCVRRVQKEDSATARARWLAELSDALDAARTLVCDLELGDERIDAANLHSRIEALRGQVLAMRLKRSAGGGQEFGPEWSEGIPWKRRA